MKSGSQAKSGSDLSNTLDLLLAQSEENILVVEKDLTIGLFNHQFAKNYRALLGKKVKKGESVLDYAVAREPERVKKIYQRVFNGEVVESEIVIPHRDGHQRYFKNHYKPVIDDNGSVVRVLVVSTDITESRSAEILAEQGRERLQRILDQSVDMICTARAGKFITVSKAIKSILGYEPHEFVGSGFNELVHPDDIENTLEVSKGLYEGEELVSFENRYRHKKGHYVPLIWSARWNREEDVIYAVGRDASEIRGAEHQLKTNETRLQNAQAMAQLGYWQCDTDKKNMQWSDLFFSLFEWNPSSTKPGFRKLLSAIHPEDRKSFKLAFELALNRKSDLDLQHRIVLDDRSIKYVHQKASVITDRITGKIVLQGIIQDISLTRKPALEQDLIAKVSHALLHYSTIEESLENVLEAICQFTGNVAGEAWFMDRDEGQVRRKAAWAESGKYKKIFQKEYDCFEVGQGLPGITARSGRIENWHNLSKRKRFLRRDRAELLQLNHGIGIPIALKNEVIAVFTLFNFEAVYDWEFVSDVLSRLTLQIGLDIHRKRSTVELNHFFDYSPNLICVVGTDGFFRKVNPAFSRILGYSEAELLSRPFHVFVHPEDRHKSLDTLERNQTGYVTEGFENRYIAKNGEIKWISWNSSEHLDEEGFMFAFGSDITSIKQANMQLLRYKQLIEQSKDAIGMVSLTDNRIFVNDTFVDQIGYTSNEIKKMGGPPHLYSNLELGQEMFNTIRNGDYWKGDVQMKSKYGEVIDYHLSAGPIFDKDGTQIGAYGIHTDIREQKRINRELEDSQKKYRDLFQMSPMPMFVFDSADLNLLDVNDAAIKHYGFSRNEFLGMTITDIHLTESIDHFDDSIPSVVKSLPDINLGIVAHKKKDGSKIIVEVQRNTISFEGREATLLQASDITDKVEVERELVYSEQRFKALVQNGAGVIAILDEETRFQYVSPNSKSILGVKAASAVGKRFSEFIHPDDQSTAQTFIGTKLPQNERIELEPLRFRSGNDKWRWIKVVLTNMSKDPAVGGVVANARDITQSIQAESKLIESNQRYNLVSKATSDVIWDWDMASDTIIWNAGIRKVFGYTKRQVGKGNAWRIKKLHPDDYSRITAEFQKVLKKRKVNWQAEYRFQSSEGSYKYVNDRGFIIYNEQRKAVRIIGAMQDITGQKIKAEEREKLVRELTVYNNDLRQFSYITSHNLRAPLSNIIGLLQLIDDSKIEDDQLAELLSGVQVSASQLQDTIDDLGKIIAIKNNLAVNRKHIEFNKITQSVFQQLSGQIAKVNPKIETDFSEAQKVNFNKSYLESILLNLTTNAIKYRSQERPLQIQIVTYRKDGKIVLKFEDNGIGLDTDRYKDRLFGLYQRFHPKHDGKGIGLFLVKSQMEGMEGSIEVDGKVGAGTSFTLKFPDTDQ